MAFGGIFQLVSTPHQFTFGVSFAGCRPSTSGCIGPWSFTFIPPSFRPVPPRSSSFLFVPPHSYLIPPRSYSFLPVPPHSSSFLLVSPHSYLIPPRSSSFLPVPLRSSSFLLVPTHSSSFLLVSPHSYLIPPRSSSFLPTARKVKVSPNLQLSRFRCVRRDSNMEIYTSSFHLISIK